MKELAERIGVRITGLLVILGFVSSFVLWTINTASSSGESLFALYMSVDLIAFAMIAYVYRVAKSGDDMSRVWMITGFCLMIVLIGAGFAYGGPQY